MPENKDVRGKNGVVQVPKSRRERACSFHARYMEQCSAKNCAPLAEIRKNNKDKVTLDFYGDKLSVTDWLIIAEAVGCDQLLLSMSIRLRKCLGPVLEQLDTERKTKLCKEKPVIYAKFIFANLVESLANCIEMSKNLNVLNLEGLPLSGSYVETIAKSLSSNTSIRELSFARSNIYDQGCEAICNVVKYLNNIEKLNLSDTGLTTRGAEHVSDMIKIQKISRYTEGWQLSLRYSEIDTSAIAGLHTILLARNPQIGNEGLRMIAEVLKDDLLVKVVDMECCGLTDSAANVLLDCLSVNYYLKEFNIAGNAGISKFLLRQISDVLNKKHEEDKRTGEELLKAFSEGQLDSADLAKKSKLTMQQLIDQLKTANEQLKLEKNLRAKAEQLNDKLTTQIKAYQDRLEKNFAEAVPEGHTMIEKGLLHRITSRQSDNQFDGSDTDKTATNARSAEQMQWMPISRHKRMTFHEKQQIQFMTETPEVSVSPKATARAGPPQANSPPGGQPIKLRKVRSEVKYVEPNYNRRNGTKSDYDYGNESDVPEFEINIGDTIVQGKPQKPSDNNIPMDNNNNSDCEVDGISLQTFCCQNSDTMSTDSATLRYEEFLRQDHMQIDSFSFQAATTTKQQEYGQGEGVANNKLTPRSMFLGLSNQKKAN